MKNKEFALILLFFVTFLSCSNTQGESQELQIVPLSNATDLRSRIIKILEIEVGLSLEAQEKGKISQQKKFKIYGSNESFLLVEFTYPEKFLANFPWKHQVVLTEDGTKIGVFSGFRYELLEIFPGENYWLMILHVTAKGNGDHKLYRLQDNELVCAFSPLEDHSLRTYDRHKDLAVYQPNELRMAFKNLNGDHYNDLIFSGNLLYLMKKAPAGFWYDTEVLDGKSISFSLSNPAQKLPISFAFIYQPETGKFEAQQDYHDIYDLEVGHPSSK
ncbi:MAG: hypothetical protein F6K19_02875 [Cyanothece sp. SIO1E1]|nr:hypothetical protein [Cyanothece sp. SIO1E1]